jgi:hypothetical protein
MPGRTWLLLAAVITSGALATGRVSPIFLPLTIGLAVAIRVAAERATRARIVAPVEPATESLFPPSVRRRLGAVTAQISSGEARRRLDDVVRRGTSLLQAMAGEQHTASARRDVVDLVAASCDVVEELDRVERFLALPETAEGSTAIDETRARCSTLRESLARRLDEASRAIETLHGQLLEENRDAADRVAELATALTAEAYARRGAAREIERLLARDARSPAH